MAKFFSLGHKIIHLPTLKISSLNIDPINLDQFAAIVFTSANAIKYLKTEKQKNNIVCFCVGSITEKIARMNGFTNTISAGGTVNALKHLIINSKKIKKNKKIAYICGDNLSFDLDLDAFLTSFKSCPEQKEGPVDLIITTFIFLFFFRRENSFCNCDISFKDKGFLFSGLFRVKT